MTVQSRTENLNAQDDITARLDNLSLDTCKELDGTTVAGPDDLVAPKRHCQASDQGHRFFSSRGTILDPLLYLRVAPSTLVIPNPPLSPMSPARSAPPTFEEIVRVCDQESAPKSSNRPNKRDSSSTSSTVPSRPGPKKESPKIPVSVYRFCQDHKVKYVSFPLSRSYRSICFSNRPKKSSDSPSDPWEVFMEQNCVTHYRLCHSLYFSYKRDEKECRLVVIVPHSSKQVASTDIDALSAIVDSPVTRVSLTHLEKELGFPTFVCPPFGHEFAPKLYAKPDRPNFEYVIDSSLVVVGSTDCVFDLGVTGMRIRPEELKRLASVLEWHVVDKIVKPPTSGDA